MTLNINQMVEAIPIIINSILGGMCLLSSHLLILARLPFNPEISNLVCMFLQLYERPVKYSDRKLLKFFNCLIRRLHRVYWKFMPQVMAVIKTSYLYSDKLFRKIYFLFSVHFTDLNCHMNLQNIILQKSL